MVDLGKTAEPQAAVHGSRRVARGFVLAARLFATVAVLLAAAGCGLAWWRWYAPLPRWDLLVLGWYAPLPRWDLLVLGWGAALSGLLWLGVLTAGRRWVRRCAADRTPRDAVPGAPALVPLLHDHLAPARAARSWWGRALVVMRCLLVWCAAAAVFLLPFHGAGLSDAEGRLFTAGASLAVGTVVGAPTHIDPDRDDDGTVTGYTADLTVRVSTPKGARDLAVADAVTDSEPKVGTRVPVLWAPGDPALGGVVDTHRDLALVVDTWTLPNDRTGLSAIWMVTPPFLLAGLGIGWAIRHGEPAQVWEPRRAARRLMLLVVPLLLVTPLLAGWRSLGAVLGLGLAFLWLIGAAFALG